MEAALFTSILFSGPAERRASEAPAYFRDLNLDQIVAGIAERRKDYDLTPFFFLSLTDPDAVAYRQEITRELDESSARQAIEDFSRRMREMRKYVERSNKLYYRFEKESWFLRAVSVYCDAVRALGDALSKLELSSRGLRSFRKYLLNHLVSRSFKDLAAAAEKLETDIKALQYCVLIDGDRVVVRDCEGEQDASSAVLETFEKFRVGSVKDYRVGFDARVGLNHVEAQILDRVALLNPVPFRALDSFAQERGGYLDATIARFDREVQFYLAYLDYLEPFRLQKLPFCIPTITEKKEIRCEDTFDLALAAKLLPSKAQVVRNDFFLRGAERILVISGPNQGGKTTLARTFGQLHHLGSLGLLVPGTAATLYLPDQILTHFEKEEDLSSLRGKLQDDLIRIHEVLKKATPRSLVILNEMFSSTSVKDALELSERVMEQVSAIDLPCVWVTFLTELATFNEKTVSMVSEIDPRDPAIRTFKVVRQPALGLAYALAIARKHRVTYEQLRERLPR